MLDFYLCMSVVFCMFLGQWRIHENLTDFKYCCLQVLFSVLWPIVGGMIMWQTYKKYVYDEPKKIEIP